MITPVNGHLLIEPLKNEGFISSSNETFQEIGVVVALSHGERSHNAERISLGVADIVRVGDKVYFDAWLAAKFPKGDQGEYYWLVKWEDVRAIEHAEIPK